MSRPPAIVTFGLLVAATFVFQGATRAAGPPGGETDADFLRAGVSNEPLVPAWRTRPAENHDLATALLAYDADRQSGARDAVEPLVGFLAQHPGSAWRPSLLVSLGTVYRQTGHLSKALDAWQAAWDASRDLDGGNGRAIGDAALAKLSQFEAYLGRKELLTPLLDSVRDRPLHGAAAQLVLESRRGLADMLDRPGSSFRCGPLALERILISENATPAEASFAPLDQARSTPDGLSLSAVQELSRKAGMNYQMAFRSVGADVLWPAVVNWKVGHYAAIVGRPDGRFQVEDATFGEGIRVSERTLDEEASGYFLVRPGPLPAGWREVGKAEGDGVWGRGNTGSNKDNGATGPFDGLFSGNPCGGCTSWNVEASVVGLQLHDMPVGYRPPLGPPVEFDLYYSHRDVEQPQTFAYTNFGSKWTTTWLSYVTDKGGGLVDLYRRGGGDEPYTFPTAGAPSTPGQFSQAVLNRVIDSKGNTTGFTRQLKDGSVETFAQAMGTQYFMTKVADPQGNAVTIDYDATMRIATIVDALGQTTTLEYGLASDPLKVTKVTDPFGRAATFGYSPDGTLLTSITDTIGITSGYTYGANSGDLVTTLVTPYGTTSFVAVDAPTSATYQRSLEITDTLGRVSYVDFEQSPPGSNDADPGATVPTGLQTTNTFLEWRNTYIFDAAQYAAAKTASGLDYTKAKLVHWLHTLDGSTSRIAESTKEPLEARVWSDYQGQSSSIYVGTTNQAWHTGRVLDDGTTQLTTYERNAFGKVTKSIDPAGRTYEYTYDPTGIDLLTITNTTGTAHDLLFTLTYNGQHEPVTIVGPNGKTTQYAYDATGQMPQRTDASGGVTAYGYTNHYLTSVTEPLGATYTLTYDSAGRLASATDPGGATVSYQYDAADRMTSAAYADGTSATFAYNLLDLSSVTDRLGGATTLRHDSERELISVADPLGHTVTFGYNGAGKLASIQDGNGNTTALGRDLEERLVSKKYADGTASAMAYENTTSRMVSKTDALGQTASFAYNPDDTLKGVSYTKAGTPTPSITFAYDPAYRRLTGMTDGTGTTSYAYFPVSPPAPGANLLSTVTSPVAGAAGVSDTVSYTYDALNRPTAQTVDGSPESWQYDALSRATTAQNALDGFAYGYADATKRVSSISSAHGPGVVVSYFGAQGDELPKELTFKASSGATLSDFAYTYDADDDVTTFTQRYLGQTFGAPAPNAKTPGAGTTGSEGARGAASRLVDLLALGAGLALVAWSWTRRPKGATRAPSVLAPACVAVLVVACGSSSGGTPPNPPANPSAQVTGFTYDAAGRLVAAVVGTDVAMPSAPQFAYAYDPASNLTSKTGYEGPATTFSYTATNAIATGTYDANGSLKSLGLDAAYAWDAANRVVQATTSSGESDFSYDGEHRLVRIVTKQGGNVVADRAYTWCGMKRCLEHDNLQSGSPVTKRYFDQGVQIDGQAYYYVADRLGTVRQLVDASGAVRAQYDYDPYGAPTKVSGDLDSDVGFTGLARDASSGLTLARRRAYDAQSGRWLSRDPLGEAGGVNLYEYARDNPINAVDPSGLCFIDFNVSGGFGIGGTAGFQIGSDDSPGGFGFHPYGGVGITSPTLGASVSGSNGSISTGSGITASASAGSFTGSVSTSGGAPTFEAGYGASIGPPGSVGLYGTYTW